MVCLMSILGVTKHRVQFLPLARNCVAPLYVATPLNVALVAKCRTIIAKCRNRRSMSHKPFAVKCGNVNVKCRKNFPYR
jgi:hypothetical protein